MTRIRIGIAAFMQESNSFAPRLAELEDFEVHDSEDLAGCFADTNTEVAGFLDACYAEGWEPVPLMGARAISGGPLSRNCFEELCGKIINAIEAQALDGLLLALHGAMSVEHCSSGDAEVVRRVRQALGGRIPVVVSHDFHANVTPDLLKSVNGLVGYRTYPHVDQRETGRRAASMLARLMMGKKGHHWYLPIPLLMPPQSSSTFEGPLKPVMDRLAEAFDEAAGECATLFCVQPWLDFTPVSGSLVVTQFGEHASPAARLREVAERLWAVRNDFHVDWVSPNELIRRIESTTTRPVLISEAADSPTGGASGDSTILLKCLLPSASRWRSCLYLVDPELAQQAHVAGIGAKIEGSIGARMDNRYSGPVLLRGRVESLSDGVFTAKGPAFHDCRFSMGRTAVVTIGQLRVVAASKPVVTIDPELYRSQGIEPAAQDAVGIKSSLLFRPGYEPIGGTVVHLDAPGPCRGRLEKVDFAAINRPIYPLDDFPWTPAEPQQILPL